MTYTFLPHWRLPRGRTGMVTPLFLALTLALGLALAANTKTAHAQADSQWVHHFTSSQDIQMNAMSASAIGEVFIAGTFHGTVDMDPGAGEALLTSGSSDTSFIAKYDPFGNFVWAYRLVGSGDVIINDIVVDPMAQVGVVGSFEGSADLDPGAGFFGANSNGGHDAFVLRLLPDGNLQWGWTMGDEEDDMTFAVTTNARSELLVTGKFEGRILFQGGGSPTYDLTSVGGSDVFIVRFNNAGRLFWANILGGDEDDEGTDIALDGRENVYVAGTFAGEADLDPKWTSNEVRSEGGSDIFVIGMTTTGDSLFQIPMGGPGDESNAHLIVQYDGAFIVAGEFEERADFDRRGEGGVLDSRGERDIFMARFGLPAIHPFEWAKSIGGPGHETLAGFARDGFANVYVLGSFFDTVDFDPNDGVSNLTSSGGADIFLAKYDRFGALARAQNMINAQDDRARALAVTNDNTPVIAGEFSGAIDLGSDLVINPGQADGVYSGFVAHYARDTWTPLPARAFLPGIIYQTLANTATDK